MALFVVHYSEIALKGRNRPRFESTLARNISTLSSSSIHVERKQSRLIVEGREDEVRNTLIRTFGVSWFAIVEKLPLEYSKIEEAAIQVASSRKAGTFSVNVRRANKCFPATSLELSSRIGKAICESTGMQVRLKNPDLAIYIEILDDSALLYTEKVKGLGGLPVGVSGRVLHLLSGGIDSPVAAYMMLKRGCYPIYIHFHALPENKDVIGTKITELIKILSTYGGGRYCLLIPYTEYQLSTISSSKDLEPVLFRYFMRVVAEKAAKKLGASGISTGDSLSQAASQTIWNIRAMDFLSTYPIFRPLLSMDKQEIVDLAKKIGTYDTSISEYKDCCSIIAKHPVTRVRLEEFIQCVKELNIDLLAEKSLSLSSLLVYSRKSDSFRLLELGDFPTLHKHKLSRPQARTS